MIDQHAKFLGQQVKGQDNKKITSNVPIYIYIHIYRELPMILVNYCLFYMIIDSPVNKPIHPKQIVTEIIITPVFSL